MNFVKTRWVFWAMVGAALLCLFQFWGLVRYVSQLPNDCIGVQQYMATIVLLALGAVLAYLRWSRD
mgnify:CR=1 FL=1